MGRFGFHGPRETDENFPNRSKGIIFSRYFSKGRRLARAGLLLMRGEIRVRSTERSSVCAQVGSSEGSAIREVRASN